MIAHQLFPLHHDFIMFLLKSSTARDLEQVRNDYSMGFTLSLEGSPPPNRGHISKSNILIPYHCTPKE